MTTSSILLWEAVEAIRIIQQMQSDLPSEARYSFEPDKNEINELCHLADVSYSEIKQFDYAQAYRAIDASRCSYTEALANRAYGDHLHYEPIKLKLPDDVPIRESGIIVCPFPSHQDMFIPASIWNFILRSLRSYGLPVYLMGEQGVRMDSGIFTEGEILSNFSMHQKVVMLKTARLVFGPPNAWTQIALGQGANLIVPYPATVPSERWFPEVTRDYAKTYARLLYNPYELKADSFITALRMVIEQMQ